MQVLTLGAGEVGFQLGRRLIQDGHDVTMMELDQRRARRVGEQLDVLMVEGKGTGTREMREAHLERMDVVAAMTTNDEVNLVACQLAKKMGVATTLARVRDPEYTRPDPILTPQELGVDVLIHPERETADAIDRLIRQSRATDVIEFEDGRVQVLGVRLEDDSPLLRIPLAELFRQHGNPPVRVAAIKRQQETIIPGPRDQLVPGDQVFVIAEPSYLPTFIELTGQKDTRIESIMILGGGLIGQRVANDLHDEVNVKIIESNVERSWEVADKLPGALVIQGDGMDADLLATEGILDMDAFIAVTGDDESNIIATLLAQHLGVPRTVALVNKMEYLPIMPTIGLDTLVSQQMLTVNAVLRCIRSQQVAALATIPGLDAEIVEYIAAEGSPITRKPLREVGFPKHAIVGAVTHGEELVIPIGDTHVQPGDKAVVFALPHVLESVEKFFRS
ncbi:Trk system potassium transporter TrkA [Candidatus Latescibacterota bacterium]